MKENKPEIQSVEKHMGRTDNKKPEIEPVLPDQEPTPDQVPEKKPEPEITEDQS